MPSEAIRPYPCIDSTPVVVELEINPTYPTAVRYSNDVIGGTKKSRFASTCMAFAPDSRGFEGAE